MKRLMIAFMMCWVVGLNLSWAQIGAPLETLPVQDGGRIKPFDTFARETLQLLYGRTKYKSENGGTKEATDVVFTWLLIPDLWYNTPIIEIRHAGLREALKIEGENRYFSPKQLFTNERVPMVIQEMRTLRSREEKLNPYYQAVQRLESQLGMFQAITTGTGLRVAPNPDSDTWVSVAELKGDLAAKFEDIKRTFVTSIAETPEGQSPKPSAEYVKAVDEFKRMAREVKSEAYGQEAKIGLEVHLNHFHPFMWAWIAYLIGLIALVVNAVTKQSKMEKVSWVFLVIGFLLHTYGMGLRSYLTERPPVANMYETVVWVPWGTLLFGAILRKFQKTSLLLGASATVAIFCLILTDLAPSVLDKSLQPLEPVLRSTFWLTTHVLIITISYAAFFLAFALGDVLLYLYWRDEKKYARTIQVGTQSIYRAIQIGVVLLAAGIILGGIWADYSWGRFWGWDPKETWALIALLGYLALLHGRLVGWVKNYELAAGSVVFFALVIMAWYGVNFVLGAGLHSYGFGAGGVEYVTGFVVVHLLYVAYVSTVRYGRLKKAA